VDVADPHQGAHVGLVRLGGERVAEKDHCANLAHGHAGPDDEVAAVRPVGDAVDHEARLFLQQPPGAAGRHERQALEDLAMAEDEVHQVVLLLVVGDEGEHG
jgi:hypothetical protein